MMEIPSFCTWDDYFIPGTTVLRNKFTQPGKPYGETNPRILQELEIRASAIRLIELYQHPIDGDLDYAHMKRIHKYIFQDVYEWAGQERQAPTDRWMTKSAPDVVHFDQRDPEAPQVNYAYYPAGPELTAAAQEQYSLLADKNFLQGLNHEDFVHELAESWGEINVIHSFREGNTRAQFVFFSQLCDQAGWRLAAANFAEGKPAYTSFVAARFYSQATGSNSRLADVLREHITCGKTPPGFEH